MKTSRLEAFSDGVFAVAITLLVLDLHVPSGDHLWHQLGDEWPSFASFVVSFWVIGIIWVNHHSMLDHLKRADRPVLYLNLLLLMTVVFIPFSTALMADHLKSGDDETVAAAVYALSSLAMGIAFNLFWIYVIRNRGQLGVRLPDEEVRRTSATFMIGSPIYVIALAVAFVSPALVLVIIALVAAYYMLVGLRSPDL